MDFLGKTVLGFYWISRRVLLDDDYIKILLSTGQLKEDGLQ